MYIPQIILYFFRFLDGPVKKTAIVIMTLKHAVSRSPFVDVHAFAATLARAIKGVEIYFIFNLAECVKLDRCVLSVSRRMKMSLLYKIRGLLWTVLLPVIFICFHPPVPMRNGLNSLKLIYTHKISLPRIDYKCVWTSLVFALIRKWHYST